MANPYYAQQGLLSQQSIVSPQQAALLSQPSLLHQAALLTPQQHIAHHTGLLPQQALLQQSLAGQAHGQATSLLGSPPARMQVNPALLSRALLNQALINNQLKPKIFNRVPYKPIVKPKAHPPLKPEETISKLEKLVPELENADNFATTGKEFTDLLLRGLSKDTATKFFETLQKLAGFIGSPAHNSVILWRVFEAAHAKRAVFSAEEGEELTKWKAEVDAKMKPKPNTFVKRPVSDDQSDPNKRQKSNGASVEDILLKRIDTLEDEVSKLRDELALTKQKYETEFKQIKAVVGVPEEEETPVPEVDAETSKTETTTATLDGKESVQTDIIEANEAQTNTNIDSA
jgi:hypothetical protein